LGISVVPMAALVAVVWLRSAYLALGNLDAFIGGLAQQYNFSFQLTQNLVVAFVIMSIVMLSSSVVLFASAIRYRRMFV